MISIVVLAYNRVHLLRRCVEDVLLRTSVDTTEILIWDNASKDGTAAYLDGLSDSRIRVVHHDTNIGLNAYSKACRMTKGEYLITLDEDVIDAPEGWDAVLVDAFRRLPEIGYLATSQVDDENSQCASIMRHRDWHLYTPREENGVNLLDGPVGGWCAVTSRDIHDRAGGFREDRKHVFFHHDEAYIGAIAKLGYGAAILRDLEVFHASGPYYSPVLQEKGDYYDDVKRAERRRNSVKRLILRVPLARPLVERYRLFVPPDPG